MSTSPHWKGVVRGNVLFLGLVSMFTDLSSEMIYPLLPVVPGALRNKMGPQAAFGIGAGLAAAAAIVLTAVPGHDIVNRK